MQPQPQICEALFKGRHYEAGIETPDGDGELERASKMYIPLPIPSKGLPNHSLSTMFLHWRKLALITQLPKDFNRCKYILVDVDLHSYQQANIYQASNHLLTRHYGIRILTRVAFVTNKDGVRRCGRSHRDEQSRYQVKSEHTNPINQ